MIATTSAFDAAAATTPFTPIFRLVIAAYPRIFVYQATGRANEYAWITSIGDFTISIDPTNGSYSIGDLVVNIIDKLVTFSTDMGIYLLEQRDCVLQMGYDGLDVGDYVTLFSGVVTSVNAKGDGSYDITCNDYTRLNQKLIYTTGAGGTTTSQVTTLNTGQPITIVTQTATTDPATGATTTTASFAYSNTLLSGPSGTVSNLVGSTRTTTVTTDRSVTISGTPTTIYEQTITISAPTTLTTITKTYGGFDLYGIVTTTVTQNDITGVTSSNVETHVTTTGTIGTVTLDTNFNNISSDNPHLVQGHPLDILLEILQTELGFSTADINMDQIETYRDTTFTGVEMKFVITSAPDAKDFMENQLLKPLGGYAYVNNLGQFCVGFAQPFPGGFGASAVLNQSTCLDVPAVSNADLVNVVTYRFDKDDDNAGSSSTGYLAESNVFYQPTILNLKDVTATVAAEAMTGAGTVQGQLIIECDGVRSGFQGFLMSRLVASSLFTLYGFYNPQIEIANTWNSAFRLELGDYTLFSHPDVPDRRRGAMGMVNKVFKVIKRSYNFEKCTVTVTLQDASGIRAFGAHHIAPTGHADYPSSTSIDHQQYIYMSGMDSNQTNGDVAAVLG